MVKKKQWKKNLYDNHGFPDNYTDKTFLRELRKNVHIEAITLKQAIIGAGLLTQEICTVVLFTIIFIYLYNDWQNPQTIFMYSSIITLFGFAIYRSMFDNGLQAAIGRDLRTVLIFLVFGYISSPVLHTLTDTVSTDTIYLMTFFMMAIHLIFFDYGLSAAIVSSSLSLNAAIFGSICLASRLSSPFHAFVLMTVAVECFALFPILRTKFTNKIPAIVVMIGLCIYFLMALSTTLMILYILKLFFINLMCPIWFLKWYRYKENIYGPWDEAIVHDAEDIKDIKSY